MSRKSKNKNVTSIAIKMNAVFVRNLFFKFLLIDTWLLIVLIIIWCIGAEKDFYGSIVENAQRTASFYPIETSYYKVIRDNGTTMIKDASNFLYSVRKIIIVMFIIEGLFLTDEIILGTSKIRKRLKPLNELADTARVRKNGGIGLGLSIAKWIIDSHNGYFSVLSRKEIGTRITVFLPKK